MHSRNGHLRRDIFRIGFNNLLARKNGTLFYAESIIVAFRIRALASLFLSISFSLSLTLLNRSYTLVPNTRGFSVRHGVAKI